MKYGEWIDVKIKKPRVKFGVGVLITDGENITVEEIDRPTSDDGTFSLSGHGFGGFEYEFDMREKDITHWMPLPELPVPGKEVT